jgi:hypothetical protein
VFHSVAPIGALGVIPVLLCRSVGALSPVKAGREVHGRAGEVRYDFEAVYTLAETRTGWRIAAIVHNQIPRLLECLARRQSGK